MSKRQNKNKILRPLSLRPSLCGTKNPVMENCAEVKALSNLVSDSINISNVSTIKLDRISNSFLSELMLRWLIIHCSNNLASREYLFGVLIFYGIEPDKPDKV